MTLQELSVHTGPVHIHREFVRNNQEECDRSGDCGTRIVLTGKPDSLASLNATCIYCGKILSVTYVIQALKAL